jgi:hypothetical protein
MYASVAAALNHALTHGCTPSEEWGMALWIEREEARRRLTGTLLGTTETGTRLRMQQICVGERGSYFGGALKVWLGSVPYCDMLHSSVSIRQRDHAQVAFDLWRDRRPTTVTVFVWDAPGRTLREVKQAGGFTGEPVENWAERLQLRLFTDDTLTEELQNGSDVGETLHAAAEEFEE